MSSFKIEFFSDTWNIILGKKNVSYSTSDIRTILVDECLKGYECFKILFDVLYQKDPIFRNMFSKKSFL